MSTWTPGAGWKEDFEKFKAEKERTREPVEAKVLNAVLSTSSTPYRCPPTSFLGFATPTDVPNLQW